MSQNLHISAHRLVRVAALSLTAIVFAASTAHAGSTGRCGGTGGKHTKSITCPAGEYIDGFGARWGMFVDSIQARCRRITPEEFRGLGNAQSFVSAGASGGTQSKTQTCPDGASVTRIDFRSGGFVDEALGFRCAFRDGAGWGATGKFREISGASSGGTFCNLKCPPGEALYKLTVKYDGWVDSVSGECRR